MRVLVTGGAGFIGSHLTDALLARGDEVIVVDDLSAGRAGPAGRAGRAAQAQHHRRRRAAPRSSAGPAGADLPPGGPDRRPRPRSTPRRRTPRSTWSARSTCWRRPGQPGARVLFASSGGALYGRDAPIPSREDVLPLPESPYGIAKYCAEQYIGLYNRLHGTRHSVLRLANVYGPRQDPAGEAGVIAIFCAGRAGRAAADRFTGTARQTRDYVYVGDVVSAFLAAADTGRPGTWNIGTGDEVSVLDLVQIIAGVAGTACRPPFAAAPAR